MLFESVSGVRCWHFIWNDEAKHACIMSLCIVPSTVIKRAQEWHMSDAGVDNLWIELKPPYLFALVVHNIVLHIPKAVLLNHHTYIHRYKLFWLGTAQKRLLGGQEGGRDLCWPKWHYYPGAFHQIFEGGGGGVHPAHDRIVDRIRTKLELPNWDQIRTTVKIFTECFKTVNLTNRNMWHVHV